MGNFVVTPNLPHLASRVEAEGASRELDAEIHRAVTLDLHDTVVQPGGWLAGGNYAQPTKAPLYTSSVDAAMCLVPNEWAWTLYSDGSGEIYRDVPNGMLPGAPGSTVISAEADTPAAALCAAALRARAVGVGG